MVRVRFFTLLRLELGIRGVELQIEGKKQLIDILNMAESNSPKPFLHKLIDENNNLLSSTIILVNGKNVHHLDGLKTMIKDGDEIDIFPPGGGG
ncbi:MoaD family protein [Hippea sp. KM1]|uniref:MoaD family protein n=1 Tax=Hippea sp. KM1 TaxID=944481 RepID=UPI00046C9C8F|nr:MoaD family protein [Hippea sp. KM1]